MAALFVRACELGLQTLARSPFIRGWKIEEIGQDTVVVAAILLRWVESQPLVDRVIVAMRKHRWVQVNLEAVERRSLTPEEAARIARWVGRVG